MSNVHEAIAWAIKVSRGEPMPARMLLIVGLASRVNNQQDFMVWPSVRQISEDTDMSESSVRRWIKHLVDVGLVEVFAATRESGASSSNRYRLPIKAVFFHPTKGAIVDDPSVTVTGGEGVKLTGGGVHSCDRGRVSSGDTRSEQQSEQQYEGRESAPDELDLGLPPVPPKDPTASDVADFIGVEWAARAFATPLRGGRPSEANAEKALELAKKNAVGDQTAIDVWREIFTNIDRSDFLQGRVPGREGRPPFKLTLSFLLEKRNFEKTLEGRFNGQSTGERRRGSTSEATGRVLNRLRSGQGGGAGPRSQSLAVARR